MIIHSNGYNVVKYAPMSLLQMFRSPPESERDRERGRDQFYHLTTGRIPAVITAVHQRSSLWISNITQR